MFGGIVNDNIYLVILKPNVMKLKILILIAGVAGLSFMWTLLPGY